MHTHCALKSQCFCSHWPQTSASICQGFKRRQTHPVNWPTLTRCSVSPTSCIDDSPHGDRLNSSRPHGQRAVGVKVGARSEIGSAIPSASRMNCLREVERKATSSVGETTHSSRYFGEVSRPRCSLIHGTNIGLIYDLRRWVVHCYMISTIRP